MSTVLNLPPPPTPPPQTPSALDSGPSTPMSGISTVAIKDGHEGSRSHFDGTGERLARLGPGANAGTSYFDINRRPDTPSSAPGSTTASEPETTWTPTSAGAGITAVGAGVREWERRRKQQENGGPGTGTDSPASSVTTASAAEQREKARFIDGMTYDEGVVDTTNSIGVPIVLNDGKGAAEPKKGVNEMTLD